MTRMEERSRQKKILCSNPCDPRHPRLNFFSDAAKQGAATTTQANVHCKKEFLTADCTDNTDGKRSKDERIHTFFIRVIRAIRG
jgi:hypothetical protein